MSQSLLDDVIARIGKLPDTHRDQVIKEAMDATAGLIWVPNPGPQTAAYVSKADELYYGGQAGGGKDLALDTPIPTPTGWTTMGELSVFSYVLSDAGEPCKVTAVSEVFHHQCYRITFVGGAQVVCGGGHQWAASTAAERLDNGNLNIESIRTTEEIWRTLDLMHAVRAAGAARKMLGHLWYFANIEPCETVPTRCIQVDSPSRMYLCSRALIPTHNSDLACGLGLTQHEKSLILRRFNDDAKVLAERTLAIIGNRDGYNGQAQILRLANRMLEYGGCKDLEDRQRYKGDPHDLICVGKGTPVLMADGTYRQVEHLMRGDVLQTLEGPRKLQRALPIQRKPCVRIVARDETFRPIAEQIQSTTHPLLCHGGWFSADDLAAAYAPNRFHESDTQQRSLSGRYAWPSNNLAQRIYRFSHKVESELQSLYRQFCEVMHAAGLLSGEEICSVACACEHAGGQTLDLSFFRATLVEQIHRSNVLGFVFPWQMNAGSYAPTSSKPQDWLVNCLSGTHPYDGRIQPTSGFSIGAADGPQCLLLQDDAVPPTPIHSQDGALVGTPKHNRPIRTYIHPYTKEIRSISVSGLIRRAALDISYVGEREVFDLQVEEVNHYITRGGFINKNCFDEIPDFLEEQYTFIIGWNRSANPNQRCRVVCTGNPPTTAEGLWVIKRWAAWLDPSHPKFGIVKEGELLWYTTVGGVDTEVDGPGPHWINGESITAKSRTFIRARLSDNPDLSRTNYDAVLAAMPEELRQAYREGKFDAGLKDKPFQLIPTAWVREAQEKWTDRPPIGVPMCALSVDCTGGGTDPMVIASRYDGYFPRAITIPGHEIPASMAGRAAAGHVVAHRRDNSIMIVDMGGGYGGPLYEHLKDNFDKETNREPLVKPFKGSEATTQRSHDGTLGFNNRRTAALWKMREALDPGQIGGSPIMLYPSNILLGDLTACTYEVRRGIIHAEPKEDVCARLGRSTNEGDSVCMCWTAGPIASTDGAIWDEMRKEMTKTGRVGGRRPQVIMGRHHAKR